MDTIEGLLDSGGEGRLASRESRIGLIVDSSVTSATDGDCKGEWIAEESWWCGGQLPMKGGRRGVVAWGSLSSMFWQFAFPISIGWTLDWLNRSSKYVLAGEGGFWASILVPGLIAGLKMDDAAEFSRERILSPNKSSETVPSEPCLPLKRAEMVERRVLMLRERPLGDMLSARRFFGEWGTCDAVSVRSYSSGSIVEISSV